MIWYPQTPEENIQLAKWVAGVQPGGLDLTGTVYALGVVRHLDGIDTLVAAVVYHGWRGGNAEVSMAASSPTWATRQTVSAILGFGFDVLKSRRLTAISHQRNKRAHKLLEGVGFRREGRHLDAFKDGDAVSFGMTRRWYERSRWNERRTESAAAA